MRTVIAFPGYRDPFYRVDPKTKKPDDVRSQDDEDKKRAYRGWIYQRAKDLDEGRWDTVEDAMGGPVATGLQALQKEGKPAERLILPFAPDLDMEARAEVLQRYAKRWMPRNSRVQLLRLELYGSPIAVHRYDAAYGALRDRLPRNIGSEEGEVIGLVGPGTPALNVSLAVILGWFPDRAKLAHVLSPNFDNPEPLVWLRLDGDVGPDLRDHRPEIDQLRSKLAELELARMAGAEPSESGEDLARAIEAFEREMWVKAVRMAREAAGDAKPTFAQVGKIMGCSRQNATKRLRRLGLDGLLKS